MLPLLSAFAGSKQRFFNKWGASAPLFSLGVGMNHDSTSNYVMAGIYRAVIIVSALVFTALFPVSSYAAWNPPNPNLTVTKSATGSGIFALNNKSLDHPSGTSIVEPSNKSNVLKFGDKFKQDMSAKLEVKTPSGSVVTDIKGNAYVPDSAFKTSLKSLGRLAGWAGAAMLAVDGYDAMLDVLGWYVEDDQIWTKYGDPLQVYPEYPSSGGYRAYSFSLYSGGQYYTSPAAACASITGKPSDAVTYIGGRYESRYSGDSAVGYCVWDWITIYGTINGAVGSVYEHNIYAPDGSPSVCYGDIPFIDGVCTPTVEHMPANSGLMEDIIETNYIPTSNDYSDLILQPEFVPDRVEISPIPSIELPPKVTTTVDGLTGDQIVTSVQDRYDFNVDSSSATQPSVSMTQSTTTSSYKNGVQTSSSTSSTTSPAISSSNIPSSSPSPLPSPDSGSGSGSGSGSVFELPSFCTWASAVCGFFDWAKEEPSEPEDNLGNLIDEVAIVNEMFPIVAPNAVCPAPLVLNLSQFGSREVSYQPLCDLASTMKFLYLALMSFAAAVLLNRSINRV